VEAHCSWQTKERSDSDRTGGANIVRLVSELHCWVAAGHQSAARAGDHMAVAAVVPDWAADHSVAGGRSTAETCREVSEDRVAVHDDLGVTAAAAGMAARTAAVAAMVDH